MALYWYVSEEPPIIESKFELGPIGITPGVQQQIEPQEIISAIRRHAQCDWGDLCEEDIAANEWSLKNEARLLSAYQSSLRVKFYIVTEADRSSTTVLLTSEY